MGNLVLVFILAIVLAVFGLQGVGVVVAGFAGFFIVLGLVVRLLCSLSTK